MTLQTFRTLTYIVTCALLAGGCGITNRSVRGNGAVRTEPRDVSDFSNVVLNGIGTVELRQTGAASLTVEAEENLLPLLTTSAENGTLEISVKSGVDLRPTKPVIFHVTVGRIETVRVAGSGRVDAGPIKTPQLTAAISGSGDVAIETIEADRLVGRISGSGAIKLGRVNVKTLHCEISGSGDAQLAGQADEADVSISGSGSIHADDLRCRAADVSIAGSGSARIATSEKLTADVSGSGSLRYRGSPSVVQTNVSGSGSVSRAGDAG